MHTPKIEPTDADGVLWAEGDLDGELADWRCYTRRASAGDWLSLKLVRMRPGKGRGRYWLGWNLRTARYARTSDAGALAQHAALYAAIERAITQMLSLPDWRVDAAAILPELRERDAALK